MDCPYCDAVPTKFPVTLRATEDEGNMVFHNHYCPVVRRIDEEYRAWLIKIGDPYVATDPGALERRLRYVKKKYPEHLYPHLWKRRSD